MTTDDQRAQATGNPAFDRLLDALEEAWRLGLALDTPGTVEEATNVLWVLSMFIERWRPGLIDRVLPPDTGQIDIFGGDA